MAVEIELEGVFGHCNCKNTLKIQTVLWGLQRDFIEVNYILAYQLKGIRKDSSCLMCCVNCHALRCRKVSSFGMISLDFMQPGHGISDAETACYLILPLHICLENKASQQQVLYIEKQGELFLSFTSKEMSICAGSESRAGSLLVEVCWAGWDGSFPWGRGGVLWRWARQPSGEPVLFLGSDLVVGRKRQRCVWRGSTGWKSLLGLVAETVRLKGCWGGRDAVKEVTPEFVHQSLSSC